MIEEQAGAFDKCPVCALPVDSCICPECPKCEEAGDPACYKKHGLKLNKAQLMSRSRQKINDLQDQIAGEGQYQAWLDEQPANYTDELK